MKSVVIREALADDSQRIVDVLFRSWCATYIPLGAPKNVIVESFGDLNKKAKVFAKYLENQSDTSISLVAECNGEVVGVCFLYKKHTEWILTQLYVDPEYTGKGIGSKLINEVFKRTNTDITLSVVSTNKHAIDFYQSHGFITTTNRTVFHLTNTIELDEIVMQYRFA